MWKSKSISNYGLQVFDKKTELGVIVNEQPVEELYKPVIQKFKRRKVYATFKVI